jgi:hypothetical protein
VAATYNGSSLVLYVNGTQVATRALSGSFITSANPLHIGGNAVWGEYFAGAIDEVRVYNTALTAAQIQADMNAGGAAVQATSLTASIGPAPAGAPLRHWQRRRGLFQDQNDQGEGLLG